MSDRDFRADIAAAHAVVWQYRERLAGKWPTPTQDDALRFAVCEAAEALDAWLRLKPEYVRNNGKNLSVTDELADCAMMLLTALHDVKLWDVWFAKWVDLSTVNLESAATDVDVIVSLTADALCGEGGWRTTEAGLQALILIAAYPGMPRLSAAVAARLERIAAKVGG